MTPSRSAHGQTSTSSRPKARSASLRDDGAGEQLLGARRRRPPAARRAVRGRHPRQQLDRAVQAARLQPPGHPRPLRVRRRAVEPGQRAEGLARDDGPVGRGRRRQPRHAPASSACTWRRAAPRRPSSSAGRRRAGRGSAGRRRAAPTARRRAPRRCRPRARASRRRCRGRAAGRRSSRTTGAPPGRSAGPRPRRAAPAASTPVVVADGGEHRGGVGGVAHGGGGEGHEVLDALVLGGAPGLRTASTSTPQPCAPSEPSGRSSSARRSSVLCERTGSGWPPWCASTTSRCTVLDPTSSTPSRMRTEPTRGRPAAAGTRPVGWSG